MWCSVSATISRTVATSQPGDELRHELPQLLHLVVVGAADEVDELRVGRAQHRAARDQAAGLERLRERQGARLGDDRLVEVEEGRGRARPRLVGASVATNRPQAGRTRGSPQAPTGRGWSRRCPRGQRRRHEPLPSSSPPTPTLPRRAAAAGGGGRRHPRRRRRPGGRAAPLGRRAAGARGGRPRRGAGRARAGPARRRPRGVVGPGRRRPVPGRARPRRRGRHRAAALGGLGGRGAHRRRRPGPRARPGGRGGGRVRAAPGATTLACALGQTAAAGSGDAVVLDCDPLGPGARHACSGSTACEGFRWDALCQTTGRSQARALREALPRRDGARGAHLAPRLPGGPAGVRGAGGALGRPARPRHAWSSTCRAPPTRSSRRSRRAATCCSSWSCPPSPGVAVGGPALPSGSPTAPRRAAGAARPGVDASARSRGPPGSRCSTSCRDQRALAESVDLGLGPVRSRRSPLARTCRGLLARASRWPPGSGGGVTLSAEPGRRAGRGRPRPAGPRARRAHPAPGRRGAARTRAVRSATPRCSPSTRRCGATSSAPVRSSRCCGRPGSPTCWSTARAQVYLDRGDGLERGRRPVPRRRRGAPAGPAAGRRRPGAGSTTPRPYADLRLPDGTRFHAVLAPGRPAGHRDLAAGAASAAASPSPSWSRPGIAAAEAVRLLERVVGGAAGVPGQRRHRQRQDHAARRAARRGAARRADRRGRGRLRAAARPSARRRAGGPAAPTSRAPARSTCAPWCGRRCGCGPTGWWSARCAAPRWSTCWPRSTPVTRAAAAPCTPTPRPTCPPGSRRSPSPPGSAATAAHSQLASAVDVVLHLARDRDGPRRLRQVAVPERDADRAWSAMVPAVAVGADGALTRGAGGSTGCSTGSAATRVTALVAAAAALARRCCCSPAAACAGCRPAAAATRPRSAAGRRGRGPRRPAGRWPAPAGCWSLAVIGAAAALAGRRLLWRRGAGRAAAARPPPGCSRPASSWPPSSPPGSRRGPRSTGPPTTGRPCGRWPRPSASGADVPAAPARARGAGRAPATCGVVAAAWQVAHRTGAGPRRRPRPGRPRPAGRRSRPGGSSTGELASARATARLVAVLPVLALLDGQRAPAATRGASCSATRSGWPAWPAGSAAGSPGWPGSRRSPATSTRPVTRSPLRGAAPRPAVAAALAVPRRRAAPRREPRADAAAGTPGRLAAPLPAAVGAARRRSARAAFVGGPAGPVAGLVGGRRDLGRRSARTEPRAVRRAPRGGPTRPAARRHPARRGAALGRRARRARVDRGLPGTARRRRRPAGPVAARLALGGDPARRLGRPGRRPRARARSAGPWRAPTATGAPVVAAVDRLAEELAAPARADVEDRARAVGVRAASRWGCACCRPSCCSGSCRSSPVCCAGSCRDGRWRSPRTVHRGCDRAGSPQAAPRRGAGSVGAVPQARAPAGRIGRPAPRRRHDARPHIRPAHRRHRDERGITTAEYAVGTAAGAGLAGLLYKLLTGGFGDRMLKTLFDHVLGLLGIG